MNKTSISKFVKPVTEKFIKEKTGSVYVNYLYTSRQEREALLNSFRFDYTSDLHAFLEDDCLKLSREGFYVNTTPYFGFKKLMRGCIASLEFPVGTIIYNDGISLKCRASLAKVNSIWNPRIKNFINREESLFYYNFIYTKGKIVIPEKEYDLLEYSCSSGIHFYFDLISALTH